MTLGNLIDRIYYRLGRAGDDTLDTDITYAINTVMREVNLNLDFPELTVHDKTTVYLAADTTNYNLPSDFLKMIMVWDNNEYQRELIRITPSEYKNYLSDVDTTTGTYPQYYDILDSSSNVKQIYLFPLRASITNGFVTTFAQLTGTTTSAFADYSTTVTGTVKVTDTTHGLITGMSITIAGSTNYNGTHEITKIDDDTFYISANYVAEAAGATWTATGTQVTDVDHSLSTEDRVLFSGCTNYTGPYTVIKVDDDNFYINATYAAETGGITKTWSKLYYVPFIYIKKLSDLSGSTDSNILTTYYPDLFIDGASYIIYRDIIYRDQPEKIAFRRAEYDKQLEIVKRAIRQPDRINKRSPKRILPTTRKLYNTQTSGYSS